MTTRVTKTYQHVLRQENNAPAYVSKVQQKVLVVTEPAAELLAASITGVRESALIQEQAGYVGIGHAFESALILVQGALPIDSATATYVYESALVEDLTPTYVNKVESATLLLVEGPIVRTESNKTTQLALTIDLYRGDVYANAVAHQAIGQTELPSRNPERWKMASILHASTKTYIDPRSVIAAHQYKAFTMLSGVSVAYPERSVSPARSYGVSAQTATKVNGRDLSTYRSYTNIPSAYSAVATKLPKSNPIDVHSSTRGFQIAVSTASAKTLVNPISITASYQIHQMGLEVGLRATYQPVLGVHSYVRTLNANLIAATSVLYQQPPSSQMIVNGIKTEYASGTTNFLIPTDPRLASNVQVLNVSHDVAYRQQMTAPDLIKSSQTTAQLQMQTGATASFSDPTGIIPGGRGYQSMLQIMAVSPGYASLPISYTAMQQLEINMVIGSSLRDPATIKDGVYTNQVLTEVATRITYADPGIQKPKRRTSSTQVGRKPA